MSRRAPAPRTGQGLAIARSVVVDRHGGTLTFETAVGRGTTFRIELPVRGPRPGGTGPLPGSGEAASERPSRPGGGGPPGKGERRPS